MLEIEKRYLVNQLPELSACKHVDMIDVYIPEVSSHAKLRARKIGEKFELTKKTRKNEGEKYIMVEQTIDITPEEFAFLYEKSTRRIEKTRYYYPYERHTIEIDVFRGKHDGLIIAEVEFDNENTLNSFQPAPFLTREISDTEHLAGGVLSGKTLKEIKEFL